jgi:hypothetical protein
MRGDWVSSKGGQYCLVKGRLRRLVWSGLMARMRRRWEYCKGGGGRGYVGQQRVYESLPDVENKGMDPVKGV